MILLMGKLNEKRTMTKQRTGVEFKIMEKGEVEKFLGDIVGNHVTEEDRYKDKLKSMQKYAAMWEYKKTGYYGRALIANACILTKIRYRVMTSTVGEDTIKVVKDLMRDFMWKGAKIVEWNEATDTADTGGLGILDPSCTFDTDKILVLRKWCEEKEDP
jgi:hypothetical protein